MNEAGETIGIEKTIKRLDIVLLFLSVIDSILTVGLSVFLIVVFIHLISIIFV